MSDDSDEAKKATAGWYLDPNMVDTRRYWDGERWTDHVAPVVHTPAPAAPAEAAPVRQLTDAEVTRSKSAYDEEARTDRIYNSGRLWAVLIPVVGVIIGIRLLLRDRLKQGVTLILASVLIWGLVAGAVTIALNLSKPTVDDTALEAEIHSWAADNGLPGVTVDCPSGVKIETGHKFVCTLTDRQGETAHVLVTIENSGGDVQWVLEG